MDKQNSYLWQELELTLSAAQAYSQPYTEVEVWADFKHEDGQVLRRPAFWDGGVNWKLRFAPTLAGEWTWESAASVEDIGFKQTASIEAQSDANTEHPFL